MIVNNAAADVMAAVNGLERARDASGHLHSLGTPMIATELQQRADMIAKVIRARSKLQQPRDRAAALDGALLRFKQRREALRA
ncbi:MAG: hypothetical protein ABW187_10340 [Dokdonella sp.]